MILTRKSVYYFLIWVLIITFLGGCNCDKPQPVEEKKNTDISSNFDQEPIKESLRINNYTLKYSRKKDEKECIDFFKSGKKIRSYCEDYFIYAHLGIVKTPAPGTDINGDGIPEIIIEQYSGGAHCCYSYDIFSLGKKLRLIDSLDGTHSTFDFEDLDGDGKYEAIGTDFVFVYWAGLFGFPDSPAPGIILRWKNGKYRLAGDLMKKPPPLEKDLYKKMPYIDREDRSYSVLTREERSYLVLTTVMVELIYTGNGNLALKYCDWFMKNIYKDKPKKEIIKKRDEFLADFKKQLKESFYWPELKKMNGW
ncbi:MAG: hypothetical protein JW976_07135 [Syntrophaceae bacterium]|nr:hypothetical protein [Syntrophaceae bacterium]